jgi:hypothetical protein
MLSQQFTDFDLVTQGPGEYCNSLFFLKKSQPKSAVSGVEFNYLDTRTEDPQINADTLLPVGFYDFHLRTLEYLNF